MKRSCHLSVSAILIALALQACVFVPRTHTLDDPECQGVQKRMVLESEQVAVMHGCANNGCLAVLAAAGVITAASAVVSGSIAVIGNVVYWIERRSNCVKGAAQP